MERVAKIEEGVKELKTGTKLEPVFAREDGKNERDENQTSDCESDRI